MLPATLAPSLLSTALKPAQAQRLPFSVYGHTHDEIGGTVSGTGVTVTSGRPSSGILCWSLG